MKKNFISTVREVFLAAGFIMLGFGIWQVYPPASFIVCGSLLIWATFPRKRKGGD